MKIVLLILIVSLSESLTTVSKLWTGPKSESDPLTIRIRRTEETVNNTADFECGVQKLIAHHRSKRIIGGTTAGFGELPWLAHIKFSSGNQCVGALVNHYYVITAAHCVHRTKLSEITVFLGVYDTKDVGKWTDTYRKESYTVVSQILHPEFKYMPAQPFRYDIAVLKLDRRVKFKDHILPICLPPIQNNKSYLGGNGVVAGWGKTDNSKGKSKTSILRRATLPILSNHECVKWYSSKNISVNLYDEMVCAGHKYGEMDTCRGDSGGPLSILDDGKWTLVGITSSGYGCGLDHQPGIYHRVTKSIQWIHENILGRY